jgi:hypothetical protein
LVVFLSLFLWVKSQGRKQRLVLKVDTAAGIFFGVVKPMVNLFLALGETECPDFPGAGFAFVGVKGRTVVFLIPTIRFGKRKAA